MGICSNELQRGRRGGRGAAWAESPSRDRKGRNSFLFLPAALMSQTEGQYSRKSNSSEAAGTTFPHGWRPTAVTDKHRHIIPVPAGDKSAFCITPSDSLRGSFPPGQRLDRLNWCWAIYQASRPSKSNWRLFIYMIWYSKANVDTKCWDERWRYRSKTY